jgi:hypothetical protein
MIFLENLVKSALDALYTKYMYLGLLSSYFQCIPIPAELSDIDL